MHTTTAYREQFERLIARAEKELAENPPAYKRRIRTLAWLGYAVIGGILLALLSISGLTLWAAFASSAFLLLLLKQKLIVIIGLLIWTLVRSLFIKMPRPQGFSLARRDYPLVWQAVDELRQALQTPLIDEILLKPDLNAAVVQTPRWGIVGPSHNTLLLGLELLLLLPEAQLRAVLAHELAHVSGNHARFSSWIYRLRQTWLQLENAFHATQAWGTGWIRRFMDWYAPYFAGYSYVLARDNEYEADSIAAQLTNPEIAASALVTVHVYAELTAKRFWQPLYRQAYTRAKPETQVYHLLQHFFQQKETHAGEFYQCLRYVLTEKANAYDTHPTLMARLKALKATGVKMKPNGKTSVHWLGEWADTVLRHFNQEWLMQNADQWQQFYQRAQAARQTINTLAARPPETLSAAERWQLATLTDAYLPEVDALPLFEQYAQDFPDDVQVALAIGRLRLERDDSSGIDYLEQAMESPRLQALAAELAWQYCQRQRQTTLAELWLKRLEVARDILTAAQWERATLQTGDTCEAVDEHDIPAIAMALQETVLNHPKVKAVWLARKQVHYFPDDPVWVVGVQTAWLVWDAEALQNTLASQLNLPVTVFVVVDRQNKKLMRQIKKVGTRLS